MTDASPSNLHQDTLRLTRRVEELAGLVSTESSARLALEALVLRQANVSDAALLVMSRLPLVPWVIPECQSPGWLGSCEALAPVCRRARLSRP
jgi:hypothetical protein